MATPSEHTVRILLMLLGAPYRYTRRQVHEKLGIVAKNSKVFDRCKEAIEGAGITVDRNDKHRYAVIPKTGFKELIHLSPLSDEDKVSLKSALQTFGLAKSHSLYNKIETLLDFQSLGLEALRRPEIEKIDAIEGARRNKQRVKLIRYRSKTSNTELDRLVEPFDLQTEIGTLLAYDVDKMRTAHFKLARMERVEVLDDPWMYEMQHQHHPSDLFEIVDVRKVNVNLRLRVAAYSDLIEKHPQARSYIRPANEEGIFDLQAPVNHKFIGLLPFLLANWRNVTILGPAELRERVKEEVREMGGWVDD